MAINHIRLRNESIEDSITSLCSPYCEPEKNQLGLCPSTCISFCFPICNRPFLAAFPPPQADYITTTTSVEDHHGESRYKSSQILSIYLSVLVIGLAFVLCFSVCKLCSAWYKSRTENSQLHHQEDGPDGFLDRVLGHGIDLPIWYARHDGLQQSVISSITIFKYKKGDGLVEGTECSVCLNEFQENETLRLLPKCSHAFHIPCIDTWLTSNTNCPMCRSDIVLDPLSSQSPEQNVDNSGVLEETREADSENEFEMERGYDSCGSSFEYENENELNSQIQSALQRIQDFKEESDNKDSLLGSESDEQLEKVNESSEDVFKNRETSKSLSNRTEQMKKKSFCCSEKQVISRHCRQVKDI